MSDERRIDRILELPFPIAWDKTREILREREWIEVWPSIESTGDPFEISLLKAFVAKFPQADAVLEKALLDPEPSVAAVDEEWRDRPRSCPSCGSEFTFCRNFGQCPSCGTFFLASDPSCSGRLPGY